MTMKNLPAVIVTILLLFAGVYLIPWQNLSWGKIELSPAAVVTVTGEATGIEKNQLASFTAGVSASGADKQTTINEVNQKVEALIASVKGFGIKEEDIETQSISVSEQREPIEIYRKTNGDYKWHVSNSIVITLREVNRASELATLLGNSGATNIYGPNFRLDQDNLNEDGLMAQAIADARTKAEKIATASNRKLGKVISVSENGVRSSYDYYPMAMGLEKADSAVSVPVEPGTTKTYKSVVVVFELR